MAQEAKCSPEMTNDQLATLALYAIAMLSACWGYGALAIVIAIMAGALRISRAIRVASELVSHPDTAVSP